MGVIYSVKDKFVAWAKADVRAIYVKEKIWPPLEKFLISGPTFIGFLLGLWRYEPTHEYFEVGFQSLVVFVLYLATLTFFQTVDSLFLDAFPIVLASIRSLLSAAYLAVTLKQFIEWRKGNVKIYTVVKNLRNRFQIS